MQQVKLGAPAVALLNLAAGGIRVAATGVVGVPGELLGVLAGGLAKLAKAGAPDSDDGRVVTSGEARSIAAAVGRELLDLVDSDDEE